MRVDMFFVVERPGMYRREQGDKDVVAGGPYWLLSNALQGCADMNAGVDPDDGTAPEFVVGRTALTLEEVETLEEVD